MEIYSNISSNKNDCLIVKYPFIQDDKTVIHVRMKNGIELKEGDKVRTFGNITLNILEILERRNSKGQEIEGYPISGSFYVCKTQNLTEEELKSLHI